MSGIDCTAFENRLDAIIDGTIDRRERIALEDHARECDGCRQLLELACTPSPDGLDLTDSVLARTSGSACDSAHDRLCSFVDDRLSALDRDLVRTHLDACGDCRTLTATLEAMTSDLPQLAERPIDDQFLPEVLARTRDRRRVTDWATRLSGWQRLLVRPRFALEAAYAMTALIVLVVGIPSAPIAGVSRRAFEVTAVELPPGISRSVHAARAGVSARAREAWGATSTRISLDAQSHVENVAELSSTMADEIRHGVGTLWERFASGETNQDDNRSPAPSDHEEGEER